MSGPRVGLIMGSDSDWPVMTDAAKALAEFDIPFEVGVVSAHRTPQRMLDYAHSAAGRGIEVIIAGAGGAAHLPGPVAAVAIGGARNAALLAVRILAAADPQLRERVEAFQRDLAATVLEKDAAL